jgi:type I restriction enzyme, S subunit
MSFPAYELYQPSGSEWLGDVPKHWDLLKLRHLVVDSNAGEVIDKSYWGGNTELLYTCAIDPLPCDYNEFPLWKRTGPNDLLLTRNGTPYVHKPLENAIYTNVVQRIKLHDHYLRDFIAIALQSSANNLRGYGVSIESLNYEIWKQLPVAIPSLMEQLDICYFLNRETAKIDALVEEQKRLIELLKEKRQAVITQAVTKGLNPKAPMKPSGVEWLGDVPAHWSTSRLGNLFQEIAEVGNDELPILSVSIHNGVSDSELDPDELERKVTRSEDRTKYKRVAPFDLAYNMMRAWQGGFGTVTVEGMVSPAYVVARPRSILATDYYEFVLRTSMAVEEMRRHSRGITDFRLRLYWEEFKTIVVPVPPYEEQLAIREGIDRITGKFAELSEQAEQAIGLLQERRSALISAAVTGKIDVRGVAAKLEAA